MADLSLSNTPPPPPRPPQKCMQVELRLACGMSAGMMPSGEVRAVMGLRVEEGGSKWQDHLRQTAECLASLGKAADSLLEERRTESGKAVEQYVMVGLGFPAMPQEDRRKDRSSTICRLQRVSTSKSKRKDAGASK